MNTEMNKKKSLLMLKKKTNLWAIDIVDLLSLGGQFFVKSSGAVFFLISWLNVIVCLVLSG